MTAIRYGISVPNFGDYADPRALADLARLAEAAGWDGFFVWDHLQYMHGFRVPVADPWILLAAIAMRTERVKIGPMVTPIARRRPWVLARQTITLDHLSNGRLIFGAGLGYPPDAEFEAFGEEGADRVRAQKLDEGLEILTGLWQGEPFSFNGEHHQVHDVTFLPTPLQPPRIPIWIAGSWPNRAPFRRAARWDGVFPLSLTVEWNKMIPAQEVRDLMSYIRDHRDADAAPNYDLAIGGTTTGTDRSRDEATLAPYTDAGMTWWIENTPGCQGGIDEMGARLRLGPPR